MSVRLDPIVVRSAPRGAYEVRFDGLGSLAEHLKERAIPAGRALLVSDSNVGPLYLPAVRAGLEMAGWTVLEHVVPAGEGSKSSGVLETIYGAAHAAGLERSDLIVALGGGVVGDLAGFAAATWLRGLALVHLPTTVLSQCDSSIGGKTGINHEGRKNLIGAYWPPRLILTDVTTLSTLPEREYASGMAEVVKHALLDGPAFVDALDMVWDDLMSRDPRALGPTIRRAANLKAEVVSADEREAGRREFLNLGHTFGHAIESAAGFGTYSHGEAVAIGLRCAIHLSASLAAGRALGSDAPLPSPFNRADALVARLPTGPPLGVLQEALDEAVASDKKRAAGASRFVVLDAIGWPRVSQDPPQEMVAAAWARGRACSVSTDSTAPAGAKP